MNGTNSKSTTLKICLTSSGSHVIISLVRSHDVGRLSTVSMSRTLSGIWRTVAELGVWLVRWSMKHGEP